METRSLIEKMTAILEDKKAKDINVIDIHGISILSDYFIICHGTSTTHIKSIADGLEVKMQELGYKYFHQEGYNSARWILVDYGEVIVHIFREEDRGFYNLERLWSDGVVSNK